LANRQKGVNFITQVGIMLKLPQLTLAGFRSICVSSCVMQQPNKPEAPLPLSPPLRFLATKVEGKLSEDESWWVACYRS